MNKLHPSTFKALVYLLATNTTAYKKIHGLENTLLCELERSRSKLIFSDSINFSKLLNITEVSPNFTHIVCIESVQV